jgi:hypothetical protein
MLGILGAEATAPEVELNFSIPRLRDLFEDACLVRPRDEIMAVGPGWQRSVMIKQLVLRREVNRCGNETHGLWGVFKERLEKPALFFTTDLDLPEGPNGFVDASSRPAVSPTPSDLAAMAADNIEVTDFRTELWESDASTAAFRVARLSRKQVSLDDDRLPNELLVSVHDGRARTIWVERVDVKGASGHIRWQGWLDLEQDHVPEILVEGDHQGCLYQMIFRSSSEGFRPVEFPQPGCKC